MALKRTLTTKKRRIEVYLPTLEARDRWSEEASRRRMSLSQMVFELVEAALAGGRSGDAPEHTRELEAQVGDLTAQVIQQQRRIEEIEALHERAERELEEYRAQALVLGPGVRRLAPA